MVWRYYWRWVRRAFGDTFSYFGWSIHTIPKTLIPFAAGLVLVYYLLGPQAMVDRLLLTIVAGLGGIIAFFLAILILNGIMAPALMYKELGGFDELTLAVEIDCQPASGPDGWVTFKLYNDSREDITRCHAILNSVKKNSDPSWAIDRPESLKWSSGDPPRDGRKDISAGGDFKVDVAASVADQSVIAFQVQQGSQNLTTPDNYVAVIRIVGTHSKKQFTGEFELAFTYEGGTRFTCDNNWQRMILETQYV
jgi:hypothetical protein